MPPEIVTSAANPLLKSIRKAQQRGDLTAEGWLIAEGPHLVEEAVRSGLKIRHRVQSQDADLKDWPVAADRVVLVPPKVFQSISGAETPQGVLALAEPPVWERAALFRGVPMVVVVDGVQDPGNLGAIARAAEAFGASGLILLKGSAYPFHPKSLRASAGSLFRTPFICGIEPERALELIGDRAVLLAGVPWRSGVQSAWDCDLKQPCAIVIGSEGRGISPDMLSRSVPIAIPTAGVESLNAASAACIFLYEAARQRRGTQ